MSDKEIIAYARRHILEKKIKRRSELKETDRSLYHVLRLRGLFDKVGFENNRASWEKLKDGEIIQHAKEFIIENGIEWRIELQNTNPALYDVLRRRGLRDEVGLGFKNRKERDWGSLSDSELIEYAKKFVKENRIKKIRELGISDSGLYLILNKRKLLGRIGLERQRRNWKGMDDDELVEYARRFMEKNRITRKIELEKRDNGLYTILKKRGLLDRLSFKKTKRANGFFKKMSDEEIIEYTRELMDRRGIAGRWEIGKVDKGLYSVLVNRKLTDRIGLEKQRRDWESMGDDELVELAQRYAKESNLKSKREFHSADGGLYQILAKRGLLDRIEFEQALRNWVKLSDEELIEFAREFIRKKRIKNRAGLVKNDNGLYLILLKRGLLDKTGLKKEHRAWEAMSDDDILAYAENLFEDKGIRNNSDLRREDGGLEFILRKRGLHNRVFSMIEQLKHRAFRKQFLLGLSQAADSMERFGEGR